MYKRIAVMVIWLIISVNAIADISHKSRRLDHALYPLHPPKLVIAGEIKEVKEGPYPRDRELSFEIERVILGDQSMAHTEVIVPISAFEWPEVLVPRSSGTYCILVLDTHRFLYSVVPSSRGRPRTAADQADALYVLEEELLQALGSETSPRRQSAILLQLAPILRSDNIATVIPFVEAEDPWVRRAALAALIYAAEQPNYIRLAAEDLKNLFADKSSTFEKFIEYYFFLESRSWRWGSRWNEEEAAKHIRIWKAMLRTGEIPSGIAKAIEITK
jgi:hypothetical protein